MSDPSLYIAVNIFVFLFFLLYMCHFYHFTNKLRTSALPKLFLATLTTLFHNRKGVFWTSLGFLNVTRISQRPIRVGLHGRSSPGQSPLSLSTKVDVVYVAQLLLELWCECFCQAVGAHGTSCV